MSGDTPSTRPGAISLNIKEKAILYAAYMPYVKGGGIFIPTARAYKLGDEIFMLITLMDEAAKLPVAGIEQAKKLLRVARRTSNEIGIREATCFIP